MVRPLNTRWIRKSPEIPEFGPLQGKENGEVILPLEGWEALRLVEILGMDQTEASESMGVSRQTLGRILSSARKTLATCVVGGFKLKIEGGVYQLVDDGLEPAPGRMRHGRGRTRRNRRGF
jgi:predicted DNA-binding protein (UPF0251 family)